MSSGRFHVVMINSTLSYFILGAYLSVGNVRYFLFMLTVSLYLLIVLSNVLLIVVICVNRSLREPMYLFLCSLFVNELYGSAALFPFLLVHVLRDVHTVPVPLCFLQIFCLYTYANVEFCNLALMSYDRYLAVCHPLHYHTRMSSNRAFVFIILTWLYSFVRCVVTVSLNMRLTRCRNIINSVYCHNYLVSKLSCSGHSVNNIYGLFGVILTTLVPLVPILFSYVKILKVCVGGCDLSRRKALGTCAPHLVSLLNFSFGCCFEILQSRFDMSGVPRVLRIISSLYFLLIQPLLNPVVYGLQMSTVRNICKHLLRPKAPQTHTRTGARTAEGGLSSDQSTLRPVGSVVDQTGPI